MGEKAVKAEVDDEVECVFCNKDPKKKSEDKIHTYRLEPRGGSWVVSCPERYKGDCSDKFLVTFDGGIKKTKLLNPTDEVFLEIGKDIVKNSRSTLREFSSAMITVSSGAIATYIALVGLFLSKTVVLQIIQYIIMAIPAFLFLVSIIIFVQAYYPRRRVIDPAHISDVKQRHNEVVNERQWYVTIGMYSFIAATGLAVSIIVMIIGVRG